MTIKLSHLMYPRPACFLSFAFPLASSSCLRCLPLLESKTMFLLSAFLLLVLILYCFPLFLFFIFLHCSCSASLLSLFIQHVLPSTHHYPPNISTPLCNPLFLFFLTLLSYRLLMRRLSRGYLNEKGQRSALSFFLPDAASF